MPLPTRVTQREIAMRAGVSQSTVSLVLNGTPASRIGEQTRLRVLAMLEETEYIADPAARRLVGADNKILGVFTYEPAFPTEHVDFYTPLLRGIENEAERAGADLLMFTSGPVREGVRTLFTGRSRLRLSDGVVLLGRAMPDGDLERLARDSHPAVAVGRRNVPGIPYVGIDYVSATRALVEDAIAAGHRDLLLLRDPKRGEAGEDRARGFAQATDAVGVQARVRTIQGEDPAEDWAAVGNATVLVVEDPVLAVALRERAASQGISLIALGDTPGADGITRLVPPRTELGRECVRALTDLIDDSLTQSRSLIACATVSGTTLTAPEENS